MTNPYNKSYSIYLPIYLILISNNKSNKKSLKHILNKNGAPNET